MCVHIPAFGDRAACRVTLGDEDARFLFQSFAFHIVQVDAAITQLPVVQVGFLGAFTCQFGHSGNGFAFFFRILYLLQHDFGYIGMFVEEIVYLLFYEVTHELIYCDASRRHIGRAEFDFGLAFKHRFFHVDSNGGYQSVTDVSIVLILVIELFDGAGDVFFESTLMGTSLSGMLTVYK